MIFPYIICRHKIQLIKQNDIKQPDTFHQDLGFLLFLLTQHDIDITMLMKIKPHRVSDKVYDESKVHKGLKFLYFHDLIFGGKINTI